MLPKSFCLARQGRIDDVAFLLLLATSLLGQRAMVPPCQLQPGRKAEPIRGAVKRGEKFVQTTPAGWIFRLAPNPEGWFIEVATKGRETDDLSRLAR